MRISLVLPLLLLGAAGRGSLALAQSSGMFSVTGGMTTPRAGHTATLLPNGKVLVAGGFGFSGFTETLATAELYDPSTGVFTATGNMTTPRAWHSATLLPDGRVLLAGGVREAPGSFPFLSLASAELYDPSTGVFTATGDMIMAQQCQGATLLTSGKVLIAGGAPDAELYDPTTGMFSPTGKYSSRPSGLSLFPCTAVSTMLPEGRVFIVWAEPALGAPAGGGTAAELYDPDSGTFSATGTTIGTPYDDGLPTATLLMSGKVLVAGGASVVDESPTGAELYDSSTGTFIAMGNIITGHESHTANLLPDGSVLLAGGSGLPAELPIAELYNPMAGAFTTAGNLITNSEGQTATLLNGGQVLITGGFSLFHTITSNAEIYYPVVLVPAPQLFSVSGVGQGQGAIWHGSSGEIASSDSPAAAGEVLSMYTTSLSNGGLISPQVAIGGRLAGILFFGAAPGYPGYNQVNFRVPSGVAPGAGVSVRLTYLGRSSNAVTIGVQ